MKSIISLHTNMNIFQGGKKKRSFELELIILLNSDIILLNNGNPLIDILLKWKTLTFYEHSSCKVKMRSLLGTS